MLNQRQRFLVWAAAAIFGIWTAAYAGHWYFGTLHMTADKVRAYVDAIDLSKLSGEARARALKELEDKLNSLSYDERQRLRMEHFMKDWFAQMTDEEKSEFLNATLPAGFKQTIEAYERLPEDKRHKVVDDAIKHLRMANNQMGNPNNTNNPPVNPKLEAQIRTIGLKSFYSQSSAQTKAEVAPLLEEMQRQMESGRELRGN